MWQQGSSAHHMRPRGVPVMTRLLLIALLAPAMASPALATHTPSLVKSAAAAKIILAKTKADRETADGKTPCRPSIKSMTEGRLSRDCTCPKPKPILM
jgi:hypothetical protein